MNAQGDRTAYKVWQLPAPSLLVRCSCMGICQGAHASALRKALRVVSHVQLSKLSLVFCHSDQSDNNTPFLNRHARTAHFNTHTLALPFSVPTSSMRILQCSYPCCLPDQRCPSETLPTNTLTCRGGLLSSPQPHKFTSWAIQDARASQPYPCFRTWRSALERAHGGTAKPLACSAPDGMATLPPTSLTVLQAGDPLQKGADTTEAAQVSSLHSLCPLKTTCMHPPPPPPHFPSMSARCDSGGTFPTLLNKFLCMQSAFCREGAGNTCQSYSLATACPHAKSVPCISNPQLVLWELFGTETSGKLPNPIYGVHCRGSCPNLSCVCRLEAQSAVPDAAAVERAMQWAHESAAAVSAPCACVACHERGAEGLYIQDL